MKVEIIAEAGVNHNGSLTEAIKMVSAAKMAGADIVKFQTYSPEHAIHRNHPEYDLLKRLALPHDAFRKIARVCEEEGIEFMSTPGDRYSLEFLVKELKVKRIKIGSDDLTYRPLLEAVAATKLPLILSTGMATEGDIDNALEIVDPVGYSTNVFRDITLLHCVSCYPCGAVDANLKAIDTMKELGYPVGYSDHTKGITACLAAASLGAVMIEKHFMRWWGKAIDHAVSVEPNEFAVMVDHIRKIEQMLGHGRKEPCEAELKNKPLFVKDKDGLKLGAQA
jgi:N,N'-diacetyllegionaminate synthase